MAFLFRPPKIVAAAAGIAQKVDYDRRPPATPPTTITPGSAVVGGGEPPVVIQPAGRGFVTPLVVKGRLTNVRTRAFRTFMFNPGQISAGNGWEWGAHTITGGSHKVYSGGSGAERPINFQLYLNADRGRVENRAKGSVTRLNEDKFKVINIIEGTEMDLTEEIRFYESFTYPDPFTADTLKERGPARAFIHLGSYLPGVECIVKSVNVNVTQFTPQLAPVIATLDISLAKFSPRSINASEIYETPPEFTE